MWLNSSATSVGSAWRGGGAELGTPTHRRHTRAPHRGVAWGMHSVGHPAHGAPCPNGACLAMRKRAQHPKTLVQPFKLHPRKACLPCPCVRTASLAHAAPLRFCIKSKNGPCYVSYAERSMTALQLGLYFAYSRFLASMKLSSDHISCHDDAHEVALP